MMLNAKAMAIGFGGASAILWIVCSLLIMLMPDMMMNMTGDMVHTDLEEMNWHMPFRGFLTGLIVWSLGAALFGWLVAAIYNRAAR